MFIKKFLKYTDIKIFVHCQQIFLFMVADKRRFYFSGGKYFYYYIKKSLEKRKDKNSLGLVQNITEFRSTYETGGTAGFIASVSRGFILFIIIIL